jgi:hypothetical protein
MACCVFSAYVFGLVWRGLLAAANGVAALCGHPIAVEPDPVAPPARRAVGVPSELRETACVRTA